MSPILHPQMQARVGFLTYRYRFLAVYTVIGVASLFLEFLIKRGLDASGLAPIAAQLLGVLGSVVFAWWMNVRFNFKVPSSKRNRAFVYFFVISAGSWVLNKTLQGPLTEWGLSYEEARGAASGVLFLAAYFFHRRYSFRDYKQVGVAVYANGVERIDEVRQKVGDYPNFIHVDVVDDSFCELDIDPRAYRIEAIRAWWPNKELHVHVMSRKPSAWLDHVLPYADLIILHPDIDEALAPLLERIRAAGKQAGLCVMMKDDVESVRTIAQYLDLVMLLTIPRPGYSGQTFQMEALERIREINHWPERKHFHLCVDGGVNESNVGLLNVEYVVSGSSVLKAERPVAQIMRLQTSSSYEAV